MSDYNIKYLHNYLPEILESESTADSVLYKSNNLKTSYLIDLSSYFISQYLFLGNDEVPLSSKITREKYGENYKFYIDYLVEKQIIHLYKNYVKGKRTRLYKFNKNILNGEIVGYKNHDKFLIKKYLKTFGRLDSNNNSDKIDYEVKEKLVKYLFSGELEKESTEYLLNILKVDKEVYLRNKHSIDCINQKQIFFHFDNFGRMHTNFTNLKSIIRKNCLYIDGEKSQEIDIKNSQPLFLNKLIQDYKSTFEFNEEELQLYQYLTMGGKFYNYLTDNLQIENKKKLKDDVYKVLFGRNFPNSFEKKFSKLFPSIYNFIKFYKKTTGNYKNLSYKLQELESDLIFNNIVKEIITKYPNMPIITVHDSILCGNSSLPLVSDIFNEKLSNYFNINKNTEFESKFHFNIY